MKRISSIILAFIMCFSCVITGEARIYDTYPYLCMNFETQTDVDNMLSNGELIPLGKQTMSWSNDGAAGSKGSLKISETGDWQDWPCNNKNVNRKLVPGETYKVSLWLKVLNANLNTDKTALFMLETKTVDGNNGYTGIVLGGKLVSNKWVHFSGELTFGRITDKTDNRLKDVDPNASVDIKIRVGNWSGTLYQEMKNLTENIDNEDFALEYCIDDIIFEPMHKRPSDDPEQETDDSVVTFIDFENGDNGGITGGGASVVTKTAENGEEAYMGNKALKINNETGWYDLTLPRKLHYNNHLYKISFWIKRTNADSSKVGADTNIILLHNGYGAAANKCPTHDKTNIIPDTGMSRGYVQSPTVASIPYNVWTQVTLYHKFEVKTFDLSAPKLLLRVGTGNEVITFYIDDFKIEDLGNIQNGDFEAEQNAIWYIRKPAASVDTQNVFAWTEENASATLSSDTMSNAGKSMHVNITADGGRVYQGIYFDNNKNYRLTFKAKGNNLTEEKPFKVILDRKVTTKDVNDKYTVPDSEIISSDLMIADNWQEYSVEFKSAYTTVDTVSSDIVPRSPFLYFDIDGNKAGTSFLIDDVKIEELPDEDSIYKYPYFTEASATGDFINGGTIDIFGVYKHDRNVAQNGMVVKTLMSPDNINWASVSYALSDSMQASYLIPADCAEKYIKFELMPIDINGNCGDIYKTDPVYIKNEFKITSNITELTSNSAKGEVVVENNRLDGKDVKLVAIIALFDENNTMLNYFTKTQVVTNMQKTEPAISLSVASESAEANDAKYARIFVWDGTTIGDSGTEVLSEAVERQR